MTSEQPVRDWIRTRRMQRAGAVDYYGNYTSGWYLGPWHVLTDIGQTWCGKKMKGVAMQRQNSDPPVEEPRCRTCQIAISQDRPRAYKRR